MLYDINYRFSLIDIYIYIYILLELDGNGKYYEYIYINEADSSLNKINKSGMWIASLIHQLMLWHTVLSWGHNTEMLINLKLSQWNPISTEEICINCLSITQFLWSFSFCYILFSEKFLSCWRSNIGMNVNSVENMPIVLLLVFTFNKFIISWNKCDLFCEIEAKVSKSIMT